MKMTRHDKPFSWEPEPPLRIRHVEKHYPEGAPWCNWEKWQILWMTELMQMNSREVGAVLERPAGAVRFQRTKLGLRFKKGKGP